MNILIAEDEELALERLVHMLKSASEHHNIVATTSSKKGLKELLLQKPALDLLLLDIELSDGKSLELFQEIDISIPVIFITAYDQYAIEAFKYLSLGYLLKPISLQDLKTALSKVDQIKRIDNEDAQLIRDLGQKGYKEKLLLKIGTKYVYRDVSDVAYFFADDKEVLMVSKKDHMKYPVDLTLEQLDQQLDPNKFFRISRKYIVHLETIKELRGLSNIRLEIRSDYTLHHKLLVSRSKVKSFKNWLNR